LAARVRAALPSRGELAAAALDAYRSTWVQPEAPHPFRAPAEAPVAAAAAAAATPCTPAQYAALEGAAAAAAARLANAELDAIEAALGAAGAGAGAGDADTSGAPPPPARLQLPALVEAPFSLSRGAFALTGVIDRVDVVVDAGAGAGAGGPPPPTLLVREFKSGAPWRKSGKLDRTAMGAVQVELYVAALEHALARARAPAAAVAGQVESIETGAVVPASRRAPAAAGAATALDAALAAAAAGIAARRFDPTPSLAKCGFCDVRSACADAAVAA
jgi:hypothetical protein